MGKVITLALLFALSLGAQYVPPSGGGGTPSGACGGDTSGTYPNCTVAKINGSTVDVNSAANQVPLTTAAAVTAWTGIPSCLDSAGQHLNFNTSTHAFSCGTSGSTTVGGSNQQLLYNTSGAIGGVSNSTWDGTNLTFNNGLSIAVTNPTVGSDLNDRRAMRVNCTTDSSTSNPNFSDENCLEVTETATNGQAIYGNGTNAKKTFLPLSLTGTYIGSGQKFLLAETLICYSMSDCNAESRSVTFAGGPINGDESQGIQSVSYLQQQGSLSRTTLSSGPTATSCNTTTTQNVTASSTAQTVTVVSSTGCAVNDWVVVGQEAPTASPNEIAVKLTAVAAGSISGIFNSTTSSGATVTPATVLTVASASTFGQDRVLVNLSATPYTTGTVASISGGAFTGSGTSWATNVVGGNSTVVGCVSLTNDDYSGVPFNGSGIQSTLKSWYQILPAGLTTTNIGVYTTSTAGDAAYHGNGVGAGAYTIRPCAKVLRVSGTTVILETNSFTWTNGDSVEEAITPYPDVTGYQYHLATYTPGGTRRAFWDLRNTGARKLGYGLYLQGNMQTGGGADTVPFDTGFYLASANTGFRVGETQNGRAFSADATTTTTASQTPCYVFQGGNISLTGTGTGICANYTSASLLASVGGVQIAFPTSGTTLVSDSATQTLTNKSIAGSEIDSGTLSAARLPNPSSSTLGGIQSKAAVSNQWINAISTSGVPASTQPAASNLSDGTSGSGAIALVTSPALTTPTIATSETLTRTGVGVTSADGYVLQNTTAAAAGAQQWSPRLHLIGQGWKTNATAASQTADWIAEVQPVQAAATPINQLVFSSQTNAGGFVPGLTLINADNTAAAIDAPVVLVKNSGTRGIWTNQGGVLVAGVNPGTTGATDGGTIVKATGVQTRSVGQYIFSAGTDPTSTADLALDRDGAGVAGITNGTQGTTAANYRDIAVRSYISKGTVPGISGCSAGTQVGGATAGSYASGTTGVCTVVLTFALTAPNGWFCRANDLTTTSDTVNQTATSTTTATLAGTTVSGDVINYGCMAY